MIIDEAQNLTPHEIKNIITRLEKDFVVIMGDPYQVDSPFLDQNSNGRPTLRKNEELTDLALFSSVKASAQL